MQALERPRSPRIEALIQRLQHSTPEIFPERAVLATASDRETEGLPIVIKRAKLLEKVLGNVSICLNNGELIVGAKTPKPLGSPLYPEIACDWVEAELDSISSRKEAPFFVSDETKRILRTDVFPHWKGKQVSNRLNESLTEEIKTTLAEGLFLHYYRNRAIGHITVDYENAICNGLRSTKSSIELKLNQCTEPEDFKKIDLLKAVAIVCDAVCAFSKRHAMLARELQSKEADESRKDELKRIADICDRVPEQPARTFWEAIQALWFIHLALNLETNGYAIGPGRLDQYLYPFYQRDSEAGRITREEAKELLRCLWIKFNELTVAKEGETAKGSTSYNDFQNVNLAGIALDGKGAENDLSLLCLEVTGELGLPQPQVSALISKKTSDKFLLEACKVIRLGYGMPSLFNDDVKVLAMLDKGKTMKDAISGGINGCVELVVPGMERMASSGYVNLAKCLELALNEGKNPVSGRAIGTATPNPREFQSFSQFMDAFRAQLAHALSIKLSYDNSARRTYAEYCPVPLTSLLIHDCLENATDYHAGGAHYNQPMVCLVGIATVVDSLAAIKKLVFEEKKMSLQEIVHVVNENFCENVMLRQMLLNRAEKYGNDNQYVDELATEFVEMLCDQVRQMRDEQGRSYAANLIPTTTHIYFGNLTGATPDGRKAGEPLSEGVSPTQGRDVNGPTSALKSVSKINHIRCSGTLLNMKLHPSMLATDEDLVKFGSLVRGYFTLGGFHVQFNVVSAETLRDAQEHPENYQNLVIRVAGYSDYFVRLSRDVQDEIISRTEHVP